MNRRYNRIVAQSVRLIPCLICNVLEKPSHITRHMRSEHDVDGQLCCVWCLEYKCHPPRQSKDTKKFVEDYVHRIRCFEKRRLEAAVNKRALIKDRPRLKIREEAILDRLHEYETRCTCISPSPPPPPAGSEVLHNVIAVNEYLESVNDELWPQTLGDEIARLKILLTEQDKCQFLRVLGLIKS